MEKPQGIDELPEPLAAARREAQQRIADDRRRYPHEIGPIFEALAAGLFEPGFSAEAAAPDPAAQRRFRTAAGVTLRAYRDRLLLNAALDLVRKSTLTVLEIAAGLGFADPELFGKWFRYRTGEAPTAMRPAEVRRADDHPPAPSPPAAGAGGDGTWTHRECRQAVAWGVKAQRGAELISIARNLYPALDDPTTL